MNLRSELIEGVCIIFFDGKLDILNNREVEKELMKLLDQGSINEFIFDFSKLTGLSSTGIQVLMKGINKIISPGGKLLITSLSDKVEKIVRIVEMDNVNGKNIICKCNEEALNILRG